MFKIIKKIFTSFAGTLPSYKSLIDRGYCSKVQNNDLVFIKKLKKDEVSFYVSVSPYNPKWNDLGKLAPDEGCFVFKVEPERIIFIKEKLLKLFEVVFIQDSYIFAYNKNLDVQDVNLGLLLDKVESILTKL